MADAAPAPPFWKNPYLIGFAVGVVSLTVLPFMQRRLLKAPPPIASLKPWSLSAADGGTVGSVGLRGKVWVAQAIASGCMPGCNARLEAQAELLPHLADLGDQVVMVTLVVPTAGDASMPRTLVSRTGPRWHAATGSGAAVDEVVSDGLRLALKSWSRADAGRDSQEFAAVPAFALVDQNGDVRGFWSQDELARGNLINAARLLARYGPSP